MRILALARDYMVWHYSRAYVDLLHIWWNYLWFVNHLFSVPDVIMNWIAPFKRLQENRVMNIVMRMVGAFIRTALIFIALVLFVFVFLFGLSFVLLWTVLPVLIGHFFLIGIRSFFA
jgi:hypothetical protein